MPSDLLLDLRFMRAALREARKGVGQTSPNPAVGAVVVRPGRTPRIIGRGWHRRAGLPHAEVEAFRSAAGSTRGATLYVTLEPCSTHGRTPPCVEAIIAAGIGRVVIGTLDPNPAHAGRALKILEEAGIEAIAGVLEEECRRLNLAFNHWIVTQRPWVLAKTGISLDGRLTREPGASRWITGEASRADTHRLRAGVDAILVGGETVRADNPQLTVRGIPGARQPWRVIVSRSGNVPKDALLFTDPWREQTLLFTGQPLRSVLEDLGRRGITSVMIEGGMRVLGEAFDGRLINQVCAYVAPLLLGGPKVMIGGEGVGSTADAPRIVSPTYRRFGNDLRLMGEVVW